MYVILCSKPGKYRTEVVDGLVAVESYDYLFYGRTTAVFVIAELVRPAKVRVVEEAGPGAPAPTVNYVPTKLLDQFDTLEQARAELDRLATFGSMDIALRKH